MLAQDFKLPDQNSKIHSLSQYKGKWVVLYFYPMDDTSGCVKEACGFRDSLEELTKLGVVVLGISKDSVASHTKFANKYNLNFTILSDVKKEVIKMYEASKPGGTSRMTYLIDPQGEIKKVYKNVDPTIHADEIIKELKVLSL